MAAYEGSFSLKLDASIDEDSSESTAIYVPLYIAHDPVLTMDGDILLGKGTSDVA